MEVALVNGGRAGSIHHVIMSGGCEVDIGGGKGRYSNMYNIVSTFLLVNRTSLITLTSGIQNCGRAFKQMMQCIVLAVGPPPPYIHLVFT